MTGGKAGIHVANAGMGADDILKQAVTVHGTVTGGADAAVHLTGGSIAIGPTGSVKAEATASGVRIGLGGACGWGDGRYALRGTAGYTAADGGNNTYGGGLNLAVRF